jgi:prolyl-tRNA editing enzyme YbaK/EbsC (Cys-tRNA(Pro) deacylase)
MAEAGMVNLFHSEETELIKLKPLSPSAQKVQDILTAFNPALKVIEFEQSTRTAQEAADRVRCQLGQIVKSMIFTGRTSRKGVLVLTSGTNRVDEKKIGQASGEGIDRAEPDFVRTVTGFAIGGVPPVGHAQPLITYIDEDLLVYPTVWAAAGTPNAVFEIASSDLVKLTRGSIANIKQD